MPDRNDPSRPGSGGDERVLLLPGQWYFGAAEVRLHTLLGSCVAITLWHPKRRMGGMCHFLLPTRTRSACGGLDGRYGDEAVALLCNELRSSGCRPQDFEVHVYGGADTLPGEAKVKLNIGERNVAQARVLIDHYGFQLQQVDVGGCEPRQVVLDLRSGQVTMTRGDARSSQKG